MDAWEIAARECVRNTYASYNHAGDRFRIADLTACFAENGVLEIKGGAVATGRAEIVELLTGSRSENPSWVPQIRHFIANVVFTSVTPTGIESAAYFQVLTQRGLDHWGRYRDALVPVDGDWLLAHRLVAVDSAVDGAWYDGPVSGR
ncbi:nuclear transport factor 2 family protein [Gordonia liuliyuniae]|uniref:Nuclear transport factor 2 family protein n=1 Tax=Gordonia liuliyuniae TaxID=2911517 RepID=A0ABS9IP48_9ACTN|nr:nuclear transport factor 2 family protein [Gordonia liuliyuniae]MCF8587327.1 nuclear transport factor 2 family protein [Gordonia liuliyuniae]